MIPSVDTSSTTCSPKGERISVAVSNNLLTCTINMDGSANCLFPPEPTPAPEYRLVCTTYPGGLKGCETIWLNDPQATASAP